MFVRGWYAVLLEDPSLVGYVFGFGVESRHFDHVPRMLSTNLRLLDASKSMCARFHMLLTCFVLVVLRTSPSRDWEDGANAGSSNPTAALASTLSHHPHLHVQTFSSAASSPAVSPRRISQAHLMMSSPPPSASASGAFGVLPTPRKVAANISTFKLANAVLGYIGTACPAKNEPTFQLALDNAQHTVCVSASSTDTPGFNHYARHLSAVHSVTSDMTDHKRLTITFRDGSRVNGISTTMLKIYTMTLSEARMITELLQLMRDEFDEPQADGEAPFSGEREIADTDVIYVGRVLKRGKMSWAPRWLVLKKFHLRVYKTNKLHVPSNNISLSGAKITTNEEKDKHLTLICMDRSYTFKFSDVIERDNVMSLFQRAMELRTRADGSLALSSIGGSNPAPTGNLIEKFGSAIDDHFSRSSSFQTLPGFESAPASRRSTVGTFQTPAALLGNGAIPEGRTHPSASVSFRPDTSNSSDIVPELPSSVVKRRKSRRTISRDFQNILCKPTHALAIDETSAYPTGLGSMSSSGIRPARRIEFAEFDIDSRGARNMERPNKMLNQGVYTFMKQLADSMAGGAHLSGTLYVPKTVWYQHGAKFQAFQAKMDVLESLRVPLLSVLPPKATEIGSNTAAAASLASSIPPSASRVSIVAPPSQQQIADELERALAHFRVASEEAQDKLAQHLSFIHTVKDPFRLRGKSLAVSGGSTAGHAVGAVASSSSSTSSAAPSSTSPDVAQEKLTLGEKLSKSMKTFGKIVSRAASATKDKVDHEDSTRYVKLLHSIFDQAQVFREWIVYLETGVVGSTAAVPSTAASSSAASAASPSDPAPSTAPGMTPPVLTNKAILEEHLTRISEFLYCVLCNMVIRDLKSVLKRYIKHCMRTLAAH